MTIAAPAPGPDTAYVSTGNPTTITYKAKTSRKLGYIQILVALACMICNGVGIWANSSVVAHVYDRTQEIIWEQVLRSNNSGPFMLGAGIWGGVFVSVAIISVHQ